MKLEDILESARKATPNLELEVIDKDGEMVELVFRNIAGMPKEDRKRLYEDSKTLEEGVADADKADEDDLSELAEASRRFLKIVAKTPNDYDTLAWALSLDPDIEDLAWVSIFNSFLEETQLGEALTSQNS